MQRRQTWFLAGCFMLSPIAGNLWAEDVNKDDKTSTRQLQSVKDEQSVSAKLLRASSLIGKSVNNEEGKDIGKIEDIIVDTRHGKIAYAVLEFGDGFLGIGDKQFAIPFRALQEDSARQNLILNVKKEKLEAARGFDKDQWPDMANEEWARDTHKHYGVDNYWDNSNKNNSNRNNTDKPNRDNDAPDRSDTRPDTDLNATPREGTDTNPRNPNTRPNQDKTLPQQDRDLTTRTNEDGQANNRSQQERDKNARPQLDRENFWTNRVTEMLGKPVKSSTGEDLGKVEDFMIDMKHGRLVYAVLAHGGTLGIGESLNAVPVSALKVEPTKKQYTINTSAQELKASAFKKDAWPDMSDMHWARQLHTSFKQEPYWSVYGTPSDDEGDAAWRHDSEYNKMFSAQKSQTITGKVTSTSDFSPAKDSGKGRAVVVTTDAGEEYTVHLGPVSYMDRKDAPIKLKVGDKITVIGSTGTYEGKQVIQARELTGADGKATKFRDAQGRQMWDKNSDQYKGNNSEDNRDNRDNQDNRDNRDDRSDTNTNPNKPSNQR